jgi:hypothetical protein
MLFSTAGFNTGETNMHKETIGTGTMLLGAAVLFPIAVRLLKETPIRLPGPDTIKPGSKTPVRDFFRGFTYKPAP